MKSAVRASLMASLAVLVVACTEPDPDGPDIIGGTSMTPDEVSLASSAPADGATNVALDASLVFTLTKDPGGDTLTVTLNPPIDGDTTQSGTTVTFTPSGAWTPSTTYGATLAGAGGEIGRVSFSTVAAAPPSGSGIYEANGFRATTRVSGDEVRTYTMETNQPLRDDLPEGGTTSFSEAAGKMRLRSGNDTFDALFAMALHELELGSVESISDFAFNDGQGVPCSCFETGEKWKYVWTRDTAYAADLGLAIVDPERTVNSLRFKLSELKAGGGKQIVQDTGSGGSYPMSTDRVVWAIGAWKTLMYLDGAEREQFLDESYEAIVNTIEQDRRAVWDERDGLYYGEQSFLDWREQTYPSWTAQDTVHLGMSKALSTNVGHFAIITVAHRLAAIKGDAMDQLKYEMWAAELALAIDRELWIESAGMFSTMKPTELDAAALHKYDLLGESLAVLWNVADGKGASIVANYPHVATGPPVIWPQQPLTRIYHNRGIWPFVTAYGLLAARAAGNASVFDLDLDSLVRGAALNLSHMENFEFLTQLPWVDDGDFSGPVVNSRRQLWSVAGYVGAIVQGVFGMEARMDAVRFAPFVTASVVEQYMGPERELTLHDVPFRGRTIDVTLRVPEGELGTSSLGISATLYDGEPLSSIEGWLTESQLGEVGSEHTLVFEMAPGIEEVSAIALVEDVQDFKNLYAPREPNLTNISIDQRDRVVLTFDSAGEDGVVFNIYKNGEEVLSDLDATSWTDPLSTDWATTTYCYAVEAEFPGSKHRSHHTPPQCVWGDDTGRVREYDAFHFGALGGQWSTMHGRVHYEDWGAPEHTLEVSPMITDWTGTHYLQLVYGNGSGGFDTGISAAVKEIVVEEYFTGMEVARRVVGMPHRGGDDWANWGDSTLVPVDLVAGTAYRVRILDDLNMTYFAHFEPYTAGRGGGAEPSNFVNVHALKVLSMGGARRTNAPAVSFDGVSDGDAIPAASRVSTGAPLQMWSAFSFTWDSDFFYVSAVSEAFERDYTPLVIYIDGVRVGEPADAAQGIEYSGQTAELPFTPDVVVGLRKLSDDGSSGGPWNGVWTRVPNTDDLVRNSRFEPGVDWWISADSHTVAARIPRALVGDVTEIRMLAHVVNAEPANEWKELVPETHTPWMASPSGFFEIDLTQAPDSANWIVR